MNNRLVDDGLKVTIDLHGYPVDESVAIVMRTIKLASIRGRSTVQVIHGSSTSDYDQTNRTIKSELHSMVRNQEFNITNSLFFDDYMLLSLPRTPGGDKSSISALDVF